MRQRTVNKDSALKRSIMTQWSSWMTMWSEVEPMDVIE